MLVALPYCNALLLYCTAIMFVSLFRSILFQNYQLKEWLNHKNIINNMKFINNIFNLTIIEIYVSIVFSEVLYDNFQHFPNIFPHTSVKVTLLKSLSAGGFFLLVEDHHAIYYTLPL